MIGRAIVTALRHRPAQYGLHIDAHGWASVGDVTFAFQIRRAQLRAIVEAESTRLELASDGSGVRARYGHTIPFVCAEENRKAPPPVLYHGTATKSLGAIYACGGLAPMRRRYVHLAVTHAQALAVGARHDAPSVLIVDAARMHYEGHKFFPASDTVWLTAAVPTRYLTLWRD